MGEVARMQEYFDALYDALEEVILKTLDGMASPDGTIQADPRTATDEIMARVRGR